MKKWIFFTSIILSSLLFSCSQSNANKENGTGNDTSMADNDKRERERTIANNERVNRAIETGNFDGIDTLRADDRVDHSGPMGKEIHGRIA